MMEWQPIETAPLGVVVMTKIDDGKFDGSRNAQKLIKQQRTPEARPMWFLPDRSMYVYYTPTHWKTA